MKHVAWGYTLRVNGRREKKFSSEWLTETDALAALAARLKDIEAGQVSRPAHRTLGQVIEEYLTFKRQGGKRSVDDDELILKRRILPAFGADLSIRKVRADAIARYDKERRGQVSLFTVSNELSVLRHLLRLAWKWGYLDQVPEIEMPKKPDGRERYLDEAEITRLLEACGESRNPYLRTIVVIALHTGMRKGEILGLEWERVDLSSARITLYKTKSGKPRGIPINRAVYEILIALEPNPDRRRGRLFRTTTGDGWVRSGRPSPWPSSGRRSLVCGSTTSATRRRPISSCGGRPSRRSRSSSGTRTSS